MSRKSYEKVEKAYQRLCSVTPREIEREQWKRLKRIVAFHFDNNAIYRKMVMERGLSPKHLETLRDLERFPVFDSDTLTRYGDEFYSCPSDAVTYLHTSGSTGQSKIIPVTAEEKKKLAFNDALTAYILGVREGPIYCTYPCGPWPSAFFAQNGAEMLGATIRADMGLSIDWHLPVFRRFKPKVIMASPSYISFFVREMEKRDVDVKDAGVSVIKLAGEPLSTGVRYEIETKFGAKVLDLYGSAEIGAASVECAHLAGTGYHHYLANELIFEVQKIGSDGAMCDPGEKGELLVTSLFRTSLPIIRYNTKDIVRLPEKTERCGCGLGLPITSAILGRSDDMLTYGGANVYPDMIYRALAALGMDDKFQVRLEKSMEKGSDILVIKVECDFHCSAASHELEKILEESLRRQSAELDYVFERNLVNPIRLDFVRRGELYTGSAKLKRFLDTRHHTDEHPLHGL